MNQFVNYSEEFPLMLMGHMAKGFSFFTFAGLIGIERETLLRWVDKYPEFKSAHKIGLEKALLHWEGQMINCSSGKERANASMIMFKLRNSYKEQYGDSTKVEHGGNIVITIDTGITRPEIVDAEFSQIKEDELKELL